MTAYTTVKLIHITLAALSIGGFLLRGCWMLGAPGMLERRWVRIAPHIVDSAFLASGIGLLYILGLQQLEAGWLQAKLIALVAYVVLGSIAIRRGRSLPVRAAALALALLTFAYIVGAAVAKSVGSWLAMA